MKLRERIYVFSLRLPWLSLWLILAMLALTPVLSDFLPIRHQASAQDLLTPLLFNLITATLVAIIFYRQSRKQLIAGYSGAVLTTLLLTNGYETRYQIFKQILEVMNPLPALESPALFSFITIVILLLLCQLAGYWLGQLADRRGSRTHELKTALMIIISVTFLFQGWATVKALVVSWPQYFYRPPQLLKSARAKEKPDIYYIVLDRYTNEQILKDQFNYSNTDFLNWLTSNQYYVKADANSSYPYTTMSVSATLNADYHTDLVQQFAEKSEQTVTPYHLSTRYSSVIKTLKSFGYHYHHLGSWYEASNQAPLADTNYQLDGRLTVFGKTIILDSFAKNEFQTSLYWHWAERGLHLGRFPVLTYQKQNWDEMSIYQLKNLEKLAKEKPGGRFVFAHILVPHDPYFFNADGSRTINAESNDVGKPIKQKYLDQVTFINNKMKTILADINTKSSNQAIVILQADEGPYPMQLNNGDFNWVSVGQEIANGNMLDWSDKDLQMKYGILAAYHIPKATNSDLERAADPINIFRLVFNQYFETTLPYLPRCSYAYINGRDRPFMYSDITKRLTGKESPDCSVDSNFAQKK